jgi:hypothetical protein
MGLKSENIVRHTILPTGAACHRGSHSVGIGDVVKAGERRIWPELPVAGAPIVLLVGRAARV